VAGNRFSGNAAGLRKRRPQAMKGWMHVDIASTARDVRVERSNRFE
jgi:hypothetical protein